MVFGEREILSTRIDCYTQNIVDGRFAVATVDSIRNSVQAAAPVFDPLAYTLTFLFFDGFKVIVQETVRNAALAAVAVFIITMIVLASFSAALIVTIMIILTDVMLFGKSRARRAHSETQLFKAVLLLHSSPRITQKSMFRETMILHKSISIG